MDTRLLSVLLILPLLVACAAPSPAPTVAAMTTEPAATDTATPAAEPVSYSDSLLLARWDTKLRHYLLMPVNPSTGETIPGYEPIDVGVNYYHVFSPDRETLAVISYIADSPTHPILHIIDLVRWQEKMFQLDFTGWSNALAFGPNGSTLAVTLTYRDTNLVVFDLKQNKITAHIQADFNITRLQFTQGGSGLMAYGNFLVDRFTQSERSEGPARVTLFDAHDLKPRWSAELTGVQDGNYAVDETKTADLHQPGNSLYSTPGVVFAPMDDVLYAIHADEDKLTTVDFTSRSVTTVNLQPKLSWLERFLMLGARTAHAKMVNGTWRQAVISPDGSMIYTTGTKNEAHLKTNGDWEIISTPLSLEAIRTPDGTIVLEKDMPATDLGITPDGSRLFIYGWKDGDPYGGASTDIFDVKSSEISFHYAGARLSPARRMHGSLLLVSAMTMSNSSEATRMTVYDYTTGSLIGEWISPTYASWITSP